MKQILLRAPKSPFEVVSPEETLRRNLIGSNTGNLVFLEAAWKVLSTRDATVHPDRLAIDPRQADAINERYDAYVIPLANAFRLTFEATLIRMTRLIERLRIPVVILGVGAQSNVDYKLERLLPIEPSVKAFVRAVLDRSGSIGVRGELTEAYLNALGFRDVEVIGCPSMFLHGSALRIEKRRTSLEPDARLAMNVSPYVREMGDVVMRHHERYPQLTYFAQDLETLALLLLGEPARSAATVSPLPIHTSHPLFREHKVRHYVDPWPWIADLSTYDFSFGTRIHGNIAAILAGTPAYVLAHDSRTLELARYFGIPHELMRDVRPDTDAADLYAQADYRELNEGHPARFGRFRDYLAKHGLPDVFADGEDPTGFDRRIAATPFPPAVVASPERMTGAGAAIRRARFRVSRLRRGNAVRGVYTRLMRLVASRRS